MQRTGTMASMEEQSVAGGRPGEAGADPVDRAGGAVGSVPAASAAPLCTAADVTPRLGRRDRKKLATRHALRSAALRLVAARGIHHVTVEDVAEAADVSTRTFFNYFASKEEAVIGIDPGQAEHFTQALAARPSDEAPLRALQAVLGELAGQIAEGEDDWLLRMEVVRRIPQGHHKVAGSGP